MAASTLEKSRRVQIRISAALHQKLARAARDSGISKSAYLRVALEREFAHEERLEREIARHRSSGNRKIRVK